ncbi:MAG TPA: glycosyltransferase [Chthoniobacterales bacterium]
MQIVVWGINYAPEKTGIGVCNVALCEYLAECGHDVTMLTAFPYYPEWKKRTADHRRLVASERINGVRILRCWHYVPKRVTTRKRILHELSFVTFSFVRLLLMPRPALLVVASPPLLAGAVAGWFCSWAGRRCVLHVQDVQPDAAINLGMVRSTAVIRALKRLEMAAYHGAWRISGISPGMLELLQSRGVPQEKLMYFPNGTHPFTPVRRGQFRQANGFGADTFLVVYAGNLGVKQGLRHFVEASRRVRNAAVRLLLCGEGSEKRLLQTMADGSSNLWVRSVLEVDDYHKMLADANLMVVSLQSGAGNSFFPSKLLSACAAGKPVLALCDPDSELAGVVAANGCGVVIRPDDVNGIARTLDFFAEDPTQLEPMGVAARQFSDQFQWNKILKRFVECVTNGPGEERDGVTA